MRAPPSQSLHSRRRRGTKRRVSVLCCNAARHSSKTADCEVGNEHGPTPSQTQSHTLYVISELDDHVCKLGQAVILTTRVYLDFTITHAGEPAEPRRIHRIHIAASILGTMAAVGMRSATVVANHEHRLLPHTPALAEKPCCSGRPLTNPSAIKHGYQHISRNRSGSSRRMLHACRAEMNTRMPEGAVRACWRQGHR